MSITKLNNFGKLAISVFALPRNTNSQHSIFGGWLLENSDLAGLVQCKQHSPGRYVTIAIDKMKFIKPVDVGDLVQFYTKIEKVGNTSITVKITTTTDHLDGMGEYIVTSGLFTFVKMDSSGNKIAIHT
jgi:acyl-CoA thioesterase YciA